MSFVPRSLILDSPCSFSRLGLARSTHLQWMIVESNVARSQEQDRDSVITMILGERVAPAIANRFRNQGKPARNVTHLRLRYIESRITREGGRGRGLTEAFR